MHEINDKLDGVLQHYGVKGMQWGVRKDDKSERRIQKKDKKWSKKMTKLTNSKYAEIYNSSAKEMTDSILPKLNSSPKYKNKNLTKDKKLYKEYLSDYSKATTDSLNKHAEDILGSPISDSGRLKVQFDYDANKDVLPKWEIVENKIEQSDDKKTVVMNPEYSKTGHISSVKIEIVDDNLQHYGIKGMKWGVRRSEKQLAKARGKTRKKLDSMKRERQWNQVMKSVDNMSTKDINSAAQRIRLENDMKRLSKGNAKDREDYLNRADMSNEELNGKVNRLRAKDALQRSVSEASRGQREAGKRVFDTAKSVGVSYALGRVTGNPMDASDVFRSVANPKGSFKGSQDKLVNEAIKRMNKQS